MYMWKKILVILLLIMLIIAVCYMFIAFVFWDMQWVSINEGGRVVFALILFVIFILFVKSQINE